MDLAGGGPIGELKKMQTACKYMKAKCTKLEGDRDKLITQWTADRRELGHLSKCMKDVGTVRGAIFTRKNRDALLLGIKQAEDGLGRLREMIVGIVFQLDSERSYGEGSLPRSDIKGAETDSVGPRKRKTRSEHVPEATVGGSVSGRAVRPEGGSPRPTFKKKRTSGGGRPGYWTSTAPGI